MAKKLKGIRDRIEIGTVPAANGMTSRVGDSPYFADVHGRALSFAYNSSGLVSSVSDGTGRSVGYSYDSSGNKTGETDANKDAVSYAYGPNHGLTQIGFPNGGSWNVVYNSTGQAVAESQDNGVLKRTYAYFSSSSTLTDSLGHTTVYLVPRGKKVTGGNR